MFLRSVFFFNKNIEKTKNKQKKKKHSEEKNKGMSKKNMNENINFWKKLYNIATQKK